ncbi:hypothetical protein TCAL_02497 [Tigriopus californicus]|uniref:Uncharacterized protein n=1 Tax=Tigriopus californicus TaxID=6832 RepID=A0A553NTJ9_TIGCA|nr:hypothetical protein TCAL_02497 [Tigriopus californicus]
MIRSPLGSRSNKDETKDDETGEERISGQKSPPEPLAVVADIVPLRKPTKPGLRYGRITKKQSKLEGLMQNPDNIQLVLRGCAEYRDLIHEFTCVCEKVSQGGPYYQEGLNEFDLWASEKIGAADDFLDSMNLWICDNQDQKRSPPSNLFDAKSYEAPKALINEKPKIGSEAKQQQIRPESTGSIMKEIEDSIKDGTKYEKLMINNPAKDAKSDNNFKDGAKDKAHDGHEDLAKHVEKAQPKTTEVAGPDEQRTFQGTIASLLQQQMDTNRLLLARSDRELDLSRELHPIGYYINDREAMLNEVLSVVKGAKFKAMLTSTLRNLDPERLKALFLEQLEGMSKKRIKYVLAGNDSVIFSFVFDQLLNLKLCCGSGQEMDESSETEDEADEDGEEEDLQVPYKHEVDPEPVAKDAPRPKSSTQADNGTESEDSLDDNGFIQRKIRPPKAPANRPQTISIPLAEANSPDPPVQNKSGGQSQLELLELEMRAKMIKALLKKANQGDESVNPVVPEEKAEAPESQKVEIESLVKEEKRLIKAREVLMVSEAKKKEELDARQRKEQELRQMLEEHQRQREEQSERERKAKEAEEEKARKKARKEEEYQKFLIWKAEKKKKDEARRIQEEQNRRRDHQRQTKNKLKQMSEKMERTQDHSKTAIKVKRKRIARETVEDELTLDYSSFDEDDQSSSGQLKRRYRKKGVKEEGETSDAPSTLQPKEKGREDSLTLSSASEPDERADYNLARIRARRLARVEEIRGVRRKKKPATEIEDGEVDSEGEHFEPVQAPCETGKVDASDSLEDESGDWAKYDLISVQKVEVSAQGRSEVIPKKKKKIKRKEGHVFIDDDSDNEKIVSSDEERDAAKESVPEPRDPDPIRTPQEEGNREPDSFEEVESRQREELEERKRIEKMEKLREDRIRRMHAFQARTEIEDQSNPQDEESSAEEEQIAPEDSQKQSQMDNVDIKPKEENEKSDQLADSLGEREKPSEIPLEETGNTPSEPPIEGHLEVPEPETEETNYSQEKDPGFYQSFLEEERKQIALRQKVEAEKEEKEKQEQEERKKRRDETELERKKKEAVELELATRLAPVAEKTLEEKKLEGIGYWKEQMANQPEPLMETQPEKVDEPAQASKPSCSNQDLPSKADVDRQQEEMESLTWADRWYQNKKVQKVVKDSKMMSRVRTQIKLKDFKLPPPTEDQEEDGTAKVKDLPNVIGSMEEYDKLLGKGLNDEALKQPLALKSNEDDESDEDENDDLWGAIMGDKEEDQEETEGNE